MPRLFLIAILTLFSAACSRVELTYRNADTLLEYYAWKTVDTTAAQREQWQPVLQTTLHTHRVQELPLVIDYLDMAIRITSDTGGSVGAACLVDTGLLLYQRHARLAIDLTVPLLVELDSAQIEHLAEYMRERQKIAVERYRDPDPQQRMEARVARITERIEQWTGKLNDDQHTYIKNAVAQIPDLTEPWLTYREQQMNTLLAMLENDATPDELHAFLNDWWVLRDGSSSETTQNWIAARHQFTRLMDTLAGMFTDRQRRTLQDRLVTLREDLVSFVPGSPQTVKLQQVTTCTPSSP